MSVYCHLESKTMLEKSTVAHSQHLSGHTILKLTLNKPFPNSITLSKTTKRAMQQQHKNRRTIAYIKNKVLTK